jgi:LmbE family N-acetylglucosaminyl deacetylase
VYTDADVFYNGREIPYVWRNRALQLTSIDDITTSHRHIFLSPHLDDVVYSCGGTLGVQVSSGLRPLVITIFSGLPPKGTNLSPFALQLHRKWGADLNKEPGQIVELRRQEDAAALDYLQVDYLWLDFPEAIYRGNPAQYTSKEQIIGGDIHPADQSIDQQLAELLLNLQSRLPDTVWYAPLGIGRHVDHQLVCSAADRLIQRGAKVYFYEDFPYVTRDDTLQTRTEELGSAFEPNFVEMSEYLPVRQEAAAAYASQITTNFSDKDAMFRLIDRYTHNIRPVETVRLERYWVTR